MPLPLRHGFLARWYAHHITMDDFPVDDLGALKAVLFGRYGINARGWRLYLDYGDALFERLGEPWAAADCPYPNFTRHRHNSTILTHFKFPTH